MSKQSGTDFIKWFEDFCPPSYAVEGDPIGLQIGTLHKEVKKVMITLDVSENVVKEAIKEQADLIIAHHPPIFRPLKKVETNHPSGKVIELCVKHDIAVYAAHTNLDITDGGVNDMLAEALMLKNTEVLVPTFSDPMNKLVVFVPKEHEENVRRAVGNAGAGHIGDYSHCAFSTEGIGSFRPLEGSDPFIGTVGELELVHEVRLETIFPSRIKNQVLAAMLEAHPYEEVAYDIYPVEQASIEKGLGRIGTIEQEMTLHDFALYVKDKLQVGGVRMSGNPQALVKKVAVLGGDGNKFMSNAKKMGADVFVTGDIYFHVAQDAVAEGLNLVDPGHYAEKIMKQGLADLLEAKCKMEISFAASSTDTNPFVFL
ncbi:Nif3-like dinuclear metal center hexameric protein [Bacillus gobiensis]|uniref:Nif3-like dinuclear metal center hexameric protein n=1 Tax=Bacillus gobiensis TaxID=1441095 RepID=UPI003D204636